MNFERLNQSVANLQTAADNAVVALEHAEAAGDQAAMDAIADQVNQVASKLSLATLMAGTAPAPDPAPGPEPVADSAPDQAE